ISGCSEPAYGRFDFAGSYPRQDSPQGRGYNNDKGVEKCAFKARHRVCKVSAAGTSATCSRWTSDLASVTEEGHNCVAAEDSFDVAQNKLAATVCDLCRTKMLLHPQVKRLPEPTD